MRFTRQKESGVVWKTCGVSRGVYRGARKRYLVRDDVWAEVDYFSQRRGRHLRSVLDFFRHLRTEWYRNVSIRMVGVVVPQALVPDVVGEIVRQTRNISLPTTTILSGICHS